MSYKKKKIKKVILPPTTLKGIETYLRNKRYRINPSLEDGKPRAKLSFDKPLPDGRRLHGHVSERKGKFFIKQHIDKRDPYRDPIGHLISDWGAHHKTSSSVIKKRKKKGGKKR